MKKSNRILILSLFLILFLSISAISAADDVVSDSNSNDGSLKAAENQDVYEDSGDSADILVDSNENVLKDGDNVMSFADLNSQIRSNPNLVLNSDVAYKDSDDVGGILIRNDVTIDGNGHTIDAKSKTRVFIIATGSTLTLNNVNFVNGFMSDAVGGVILASGSVKVNNCVFTNCKVVGSEASGGVISGAGAMNFVNCIFKGCTAGKYGGAIHSSTVVCDGCTFNDCSAVQFGGAVFGKPTIIRCTFNNDVAPNGGAVGGTSKLYYSTFNNCIATDDVSKSPNDDVGGGAACGAIPVAEGCIFNNCKAPKAYGGALRGTTVAKNCEFNGCEAIQGGGIRGKGDTIGCTFTNCVATTDMGGGVFTQEANIINCNFIGCSAARSNAGGVYAGVGVKITNCKFTQCRAPNGCGGAVYGKAVVSACTFKQNSAKFGGAVGSPNLVVTNSVFTGNTASKGGAAYNTKSLTSCTFNKNSATYGGAAYNINSISSCKFNQNTATYGGAVSNAKNVVSSKFTNNKAKYGAVSYNDINVVFKKITVKNTIKLVKGLFYNQKRKLTLTNSKIDNRAKFGKYLNYNSGVFIYSKNTLKSTPKVKKIASPRNVQKK